MAEQNMGPIRCSKCGQMLVVGSTGTFQDQYHDFNTKLKEIECSAPKKADHPVFLDGELTSFGFTKVTEGCAPRTGFEKS